MDEKKDPKDLADQFAGDVDYMRTLLGAAEDKVRFYLENRRLLASRGELLHSCARELSNLLALTQDHLDRIDTELGAVTELLYSIEPPVA